MLYLKNTVYQNNLPVCFMWQFASSSTTKTGCEDLKAKNIKLNMNANCKIC